MLNMLKNYRGFKMKSISKSAMYIAKLDEFDDVWEVFKKNRKYLGHVLKAKIRSRLENQNVIFEDGVVITFHISKVNSKLGRDTDVKIKTGDCILHQIGSLDKGCGNGSKILKRFFNHVNTDVYLSVLEENESAIKFYEKNGMIKVGYINWSGGKMKGLVYKFSMENKCSDTSSDTNINKSSIPKSTIIHNTLSSNGIIQILGLSHKVNILR